MEESTLRWVRVWSWLGLGREHCRTPHMGAHELPTRRLFNGDNLFYFYYEIIHKIYAIRIKGKRKILSIQRLSNKSQIMRHQQPWRRYALYRVPESK